MNDPIETATTNDHHGTRTLDLQLTDTYLAIEAKRTTTESDVTIAIAPTNADVVSRAADPVLESIDIAPAAKKHEALHAKRFANDRKARLRGAAPETGRLKGLIDTCLPLRQDAREMIIHGRNTLPMIELLRV